MVEAVTAAGVDSCSVDGSDRLVICRLPRFQTNTQIVRKPQLSTLARNGCPSVVERVGSKGLAPSRPARDRQPFPSSLRPCARVERAGTGRRLPYRRVYAVVLGPRADYRTMKMTGSAINKTIKQTKAAISIWSPSVWPRIEASRRRGFLTFKRGKVGQSSIAAPAGLPGCSSR
jgi:hypothetical protein